MNTRQTSLFDTTPPKKPEATKQDAPAQDTAPVETTPPKPNAPDEFSVSEISHKLKSMVEKTFDYVRVRGELSRVTVAKSGHCYTSLKDDKAVLDAICWRGTLSRLSIQPEEGLDVVVTGRLTTYPGRSNYQMIIETMELAGEGALLKMLEERRKKLAAEGLFDESRKKAVPFLPKTIGVVTSPTGAVIRDIHHRIQDRFPRPIYLYPAVVQGDQAAESVVKGIAFFNALPDDSLYRPDVLIVGRGGGSLEDLMPFNDERVVRAIADSHIPIISAVGHETDTTLSDFAADLRAPTPTGAAEKAVPVRRELLQGVQNLSHRLNEGIGRGLEHRRNTLGGIARGLIHPRAHIEQRKQRLDHAVHRLDGGLNQAILTRRHSIDRAAAKLSLQPFKNALLQHKKTLARLSEGLGKAMTGTIQQRQQKLTTQASLLHSLSYERTLERGYALIQTPNGTAISSVDAAKGHSSLNIRFKDGKLGVQVDQNTD